VNLKDKHIVVVDTGLALSITQVLARSFGKVSYYLPNDESYPCSDKDEIGTGINGVTRIYELFDCIHLDPKDRTVDCFFFPDIGFSGLQEHLIDLGYPVAGSLCSDLMELDKEKFYKTLAKAGLPVAPTVTIIGTEKLYAYLKTHKNVVVKISKHRGMTETRKVLDLNDAEPWLDDLECKLGRRKMTQKFIVQDMIESDCEIGMDSLCLDGEHPENSMIGIEAKDSGYFGAVVKEFPPIMQNINDAMKPTFARLGFRGFHSNEIRITEKGEAYSIDDTCRQPSPPGELFPEMYKDFSQAIWDLAHDKMPALNPVAKYGAELILTSEWYGKGHWLKVSYPEEIAQFVKLKNFCKKDGDYWIVPNDNDNYIGAVVATGDNPDKVMAQCLEYAGQVKGYKVTFNDSAFCEVSEACKAAEKHGVKIL
jgi:hypothetical protein